MKAELPDQRTNTDVNLVVPDVHLPLPKTAAVELLALLVEEHERASGTPIDVQEAA